MISPYVRRLRLGIELRALRLERNMNQDRLARLTGRSRMDISRLETGQSADQTAVLDILDALAVADDRWTALATLAEEASLQGWWESVRHMGERQALYANVEAGATSIRAYEQTFLPGLLQVPEYIEANAAALESIEPLAPATLDGMLAGRAGRQRNLRRPGGPTTEILIDESAIFRLAVPPDVTKQQLKHIAGVITSGPPNITVRVLKMSARIRDYTVPRCTFSIYDYPDPGDPTVVAIDTVTEDVLLTSAEKVAPYEKLYGNLRDAALTPEQSADFLTKAAWEIGGLD
jgi:transcriptional regulator with XRE-family HTH domain